ADTPVQASAGRVTPNFFSVLGVPPALGRTFGPEGSEGPRPLGVVISYEFWQGAFAGAPDILGRSLRVDGAATDVIGVLPEGFKLLFPPDGSIPERLDVYVALPWNLRNLPAAQQYLRVVGRLAPGMDLTGAQRAVDAVTERVHEVYPELAATGDRFSVHPLHGDVVRAARPVLAALLAGVGLLLLLASANVASLVLARASVRQREMAVRSSLGATRGRLAQLVVLESLVIGLLATVVGLCVGALGSRILWSLRPEGIARIDTVDLDGTVVAFTLTVSLVATLLFGLAPLSALGKAGPAQSLRAADGRSLGAGRRAREWVTVVEVALGMVLLVGASLMGQTLARVGQADLGFSPERVLTFKVSLSERLFPTSEERWEIARGIDRRVSGLAGVAGAGATSHVPLGTWANWAADASPEGVPESGRDAYFADHRSVTPGYFAAIGATLVEGRFFDAGDDGASAPVVILDQAMAERAFPGEDAVGRTLNPSRYVGGGFETTPATVVGVVADVRDVSPARPSGGQLFWPFAQSARWELTWVVRAEDDATALLPRIREEVRAVSPDLAVANVALMDDLRREATGDVRFVALLGGIFSVLALALAALGLYGVVTYVAVQRAPEFGLMMVLGARPRRILGEVLRSGVVLGGAGVAVGTVAAVGLTRFLRSLLYGVSPTDVWTFGGVASFFLVVVLAASLGPALRAVRVDPAAIMRD
ncbi:MAG TPA: ADOP family duplicated permease, partial [Longimicrobiales bacterium]|nr:ADOP family duplicated permease [Longimicrobiales bacterium]